MLLTVLLTVVFGRLSGTTVPRKPEAQVSLQAIAGLSRKPEAQVSLQAIAGLSRKPEAQVSLQAIAGNYRKPEAQAERGVDAAPHIDARA